MGDRSNIVMVEEEGNRIFFYAHWAGSELPKILKKALIRGKDRWDDEPYLARIIFSEMVKDSVLEQTGFGISTYRCDQEHPDLEVHTSKQKVICGSKEWTFEEYININPTY